MRQRLKEPLGAPFIEHVLGPRLAIDARAALPAMVAANQAHLVMLHAAGLIDAAAAAPVARALAEIARDGIPAAELDPALEDLYANLERRVTTIAGEDAAGRMHLARSRNDLWATVARMNARGTILRAGDALADLRERLLDLAREHAGHVLPGMTHLQPAQPITAGFYLHAIEQALGRDAARLADAYPRANRCPLGAGALAGTSFPIDRALTARLLGFDAPLASGLDGVASRDFALEILGALALAAVTLSRLAEDLYFWSSMQVGLLDVSGAVSVASSIMPQKKNAAALEHVKGRAGQVVGALTAALAASKGTHFMHARDTSIESTLPLAQGEEAMGVMTALTRAVLDAVTFLPDVGRTRAAGDFSTITDLADLLVRDAGLPFRLAHEICATLVRDALDAGAGPGSIDAARVNAAATERAGFAVRLSERAVRDALDPEASVARRAHLGGTAPDTVRAAVTAARAELDADRRTIAARREALASAGRDLDARSAALGALA